MPPTIAIPKEYEAEVVQKVQLTPKIIFLKAQTADPISYQAGQYASFLIHEHRRPLSYATPAKDRSLEFFVDISPGGVASQYTLQLETHDHFRFLSPYGRFVLDEQSSLPLLFIATGSGIAPIRAQILYELARPTPRPMTLFFGNRNEEHMFLEDEFTQLARTQPHFMFIPVYSEPSAHWPGARGLVTEIVPQRIAAMDTYDTYICGNPRMVKDMAAILAAAGAPREQIHTEQFT